jgi:hypothetical protein
MALECPNDAQPKEFYDAPFRDFDGIVRVSADFQGSEKAGLKLEYAP